MVLVAMKRYRKTNKVSVLHMGENPSYSITTFSKEADSQHHKTSNKAVADVTPMDENPSYCITTFNKTPDDSGTNMCAAANTPHKQTELDGNMYDTVGEKLGTNFVNIDEGAAEEATERAKYKKKDTTAEYCNLNIVCVS